MVQMICAETVCACLHAALSQTKVGARSSGWPLPAAAAMAHNRNSLGDTMSRLRFALVVFGPTVAVGSVRTVQQAALLQYQNAKHACWLGLRCYHDTDSDYSSASSSLWRRGLW